MKRNKCKFDLIYEVAEMTGVDVTDVEKVVNGILDHVSDDLRAGCQYRISGFGRLYVNVSAPRVARNINTGETVMVPTTKRVKFKSYIKI